jgi:hypothetical protein
MVWVMLNPSTANADTDDQTLKKCMGFARQHGHGGVILVNLFALMARDPRKLLTSADPVGPENDEHILSACRSGGAIIAGWGARPFAHARATHVRELIDGTGRAVSCVGLTKEGDPRHPLHPPYSSAFHIFSAAGQMPTRP